MKQSGQKRGNGRSYRWLREHISYAGDDCLIWPFSRCNGYAHLGHLGKMHYGHRMMCEMVHGPAPSSRHEASHSCGRGHLGCVNPRHLSWKTKSQNQRDRARHGTTSVGWKGKITPQQANEIRKLRGKLLQREIAERFGISRANVSLIHCNKLWTERRHPWDKRTFTPVD